MCVFFLPVHLYTKDIIATWASLHEGSRLFSSKIHEVDGARLPLEAGRIIKNHIMILYH